MARHAGTNIICFGIPVEMAVEMAWITPSAPFKLSNLRPMAGREIQHILRAALPMFSTMILTVLAGRAPWLCNLVARRHAAEWRWPLRTASHARPI